MQEDLAVRTNILRKGARVSRDLEPTPEVAQARRQESIEQLAAIISEKDRYKRALQRIAESDDAACPHVKVALEALNPAPQ